MSLGLTKEEMMKLVSFGNSEAQIKKNLSGGKTDRQMGTSEIIAHVTAYLVEKNIELLLANNERISRQLAAAGVRLAD